MTDITSTNYLLPWQSTIANVMEGITFALLVCLAILFVVHSRKKRITYKMRVCEQILGVAFLLSGMFWGIATISFLVNVTLGWKLSLATGALTAFFFGSIFWTLFIIRNRKLNKTSLGKSMCVMAVALVSLAGMLSLVDKGVRKSKDHLQSCYFIEIPQEADLTLWIG